MNKIHIKLWEVHKNFHQMQLFELHIQQKDHKNLIWIVPKIRGDMRGDIIDEEMEKKLGKSAKLKNSVIENEFILNQN